MKSPVLNFINGLMKVVLLLAFFCTGYWTKSIIDAQQITDNKIRSNGCRLRQNAKEKRLTS